MHFRGAKPIHPINFRSICMEIGKWQNTETRGKNIVGKKKKRNNKKKTFTRAQWDEIHGNEIHLLIIARFMIEFFFFFISFRSSSIQVRFFTLSRDFCTRLLVHFFYLARVCCVVFFFILSRFL